MIFISGLDFLKYMTERLATYFNIKPIDQEDANEYSQLGYTNRWFGMIPFAIKTFFRNNKSRRF